MKETLSIIIPAYNEERTIRRILEKICAVELPVRKEIIVIDDSSWDETGHICKGFRTPPSDSLIYEWLPRNHGKGYAVRQGIALATGKWTVIQDADLEYDPEDYRPLLEWMVEHDGKVVYGSRFLNRANRHSYFSFYLGGRLVSFVANVLYGQHLTDEPTCYKFFDTAFLKSIPLECEGFEFCPEVTAKVCKRGIKIHEIPIRYYPRSIAAGKKIRWTDGLEAIWTLIKYRFKA